MGREGEGRGGREKRMWYGEARDGRGGERGGGMKVGMRYERSEEEEKVG